MIEIGEELSKISFKNFAFELTPKTIKTSEDQKILLDLTKLKLNLQKLLQKPSVIENPDTWHERSKRESARIGYIYSTLFALQKHTLLPLFNFVLESLSYHNYSQFLIIKNIIRTNFNYENISSDKRSDADISKAVQRGINAHLFLKLMDVVEILRQKYFPGKDIITFQIDVLKKDWFNIKDFVYDFFEKILEREIFFKWIPTGFLIENSSESEVFSLTHRMVKEINLFDLIELAFQKKDINIDIDTNSLNSELHFKWGCQLQLISLIEYVQRFQSYLPSVAFLKHTLSRLLYSDFVSDCKYKNDDIVIDPERLKAVGYLYEYFFKGSEEEERENFLRYFNKFFEKLTLHDFFQFVLKKGYLSINPEILFKGDLDAYEISGKKATNILLIDVFELTRKKFFLQVSDKDLKDKFSNLKEPLNEVLKNVLKKMKVTYPNEGHFVIEK